MIKLPFAITTLSCTILLLLLCTLLQIQTVNAGISSFHDLQKKLSPSPLDVLDDLDTYEKFWIEVHPKSCGEYSFLYCCFCLFGVLQIVWRAVQCTIDCNIVR